MSKIVFADGSEVKVNDVSSVFAITIDTVDPDEVEAFQQKLTNSNLTSFRIENPDPDMCSEGTDFTFIEIDRQRMMMGVGDAEPTNTTFLCRPLNETEKKLLMLIENDEASSSAIQELAEIIAELI